MKKYILAIDQGTTSSRAILFNKEGNPVFKSQKEVVCIYPHEGWVESNANEIWLSVVDCIQDVLAKAKSSFDEVEAIGITNQRETTVVWDKETGEPIYNAIVWQSRQTTEICDSLSEYEEMLHEKTGLLINPYFSASKVKFILDKLDPKREKANSGQLLFGTIDTWLIYNLTKGQVHATDVSNASRTMLFNINTLEWDEDLLKVFDIPRKMLPNVCASSYDFGVAKFFTKDVHITGVAGDQQASLFGHVCFTEGDSKNTYGTGCFMLMNTGEKPVLSKKGLLTTIAWQIGDKVTYALEGSVFAGGAAIQWLRDGMRIIDEASDADYYATGAGEENGVYFVPAFVGLGTPYWDDDVRGAIFGITRGTNKKHIARATLEGIAYQVKDVFDAMKDESKLELNVLEVDGGATNSNILMQFQSDICRIEIKKPVCLETTALGVCYLAGLYTGAFKNLTAITKLHEYSVTFSPSLDANKAQQKYETWKLAVRAAMVFKPGK